MFPPIGFWIFVLGLIQVNDGDSTSSQDKNANNKGPASVDLKGQFSWELLVDVDNSDNDGAVTREVAYKTSLHVSRKKLETEVRDAISGGADAVVVVLSVDLPFGGLSPEAVKKLQEIIKANNPDIQEEQQLTTIINVKEKCSLKLYQLVFNGPGMSQKLEKLSSTPHPLNDVIISCSYRTKSNGLIQAFRNGRKIQ